MLSIGDFARHGRVSVRMLRHYDGIGLLRPAAVDPVTGYRSYEASQFADLNQIVDLEVSKLVKRLKDKDIALTLTDEARDLLSTKGFDPAYGARPMRRE